MLSRKKKPLWFALIDSENLSEKKAILIAKTVQRNFADAILVGGSTITDQTELDKIIKAIKRSVRLPVILFPGNITGISQFADAILFTSLLNSDNPYFITQAQVLGSLSVKKYNLEAIPTGYIIIGDGGTTGFIGRARGLPPDKPQIAAMYSLAANYMGMRFIYLEAGSGATSHISPDIIKTTKKISKCFLIVGGGIKNADTAKTIIEAGADAIVIGTLLEKEHYKQLSSIIKSIHK
ncbi:MAG: geranylgeranylglyceryl/heptaprenylglyceryl phosphate synthase [Thaumarchaeota archaeon]|nr:geranylgeranylglyceryl/heptaprenylglyceryl phosphate synthase [Nitrososphaerota archaeon]